jgi:asparagine synthase (glutamine-hydrolysing)
MSGIAGAYQQVDGEPAARLMSERLAHRGPDGDGFYSFVNNSVSTYIGHRRLAVLDPVRGHQPLVKHHLALSYDGELYNFRELSAELALSGSKFETSSDAEVVVEAWRRWGHGCLRRLRGMFAFALFDETTGSLFFARDQFGIKPLHYLRRKDGVVFASELKALVAAFGPELQIEPGALIASILYYWVPDRRCSVHRVEKLQPGTWAEFRPDGTFRTETYFDIAEVAAVAAAGPPVDLAEVIEASVVSHLVADVPVSSFLSGGLDSSIVAALAKRANHDVDAYTVAPKAALAGRGTMGRPGPATSLAATGSTCTRSKWPSTWPTCCQSSWGSWTSRSATRERSPRC